MNVAHVMKVDAVPHPRIGRLFHRDSGRALMVAFDLSLVAGPVPYSEDARATLRTIVEARPEAVLLGPGLIKQCGHLFAWHGAPAIVARIDYPLVGPMRVSGVELEAMVCTPEHAAALGADAVVMCLIDGWDDPARFARNIEDVTRAAKACHAIGMPLIVEAVLWGNRHKDQKDATRLAAICRIAAELGADLIKTQYPGTPEGMRLVTQGCPVPVLVLGGPAVDDMSVVEGFARGALEGGARGFIFGRNVWQRKDVSSMAGKLLTILHGG